MCVVYRMVAVDVCVVFRMVTVDVCCVQDGVGGCRCVCCVQDGDC